MFQCSLILCAAAITCSSTVAILQTVVFVVRYLLNTFFTLFVKVLLTKFCNYVSFLSKTRHFCFDLISACFSSILQLISLTCRIWKKLNFFDIPPKFELHTCFRSNQFFDLFLPLRHAFNIKNAKLKVINNIFVISKITTADSASVSIYRISSVQWSVCGQISELWI